MKLRSKTEKQKANNRKIQRERESRNIVDLKYIFPSWLVFAPLPSCLITQISSQIKKKIKKIQNRIEQNMKLKLTDNCVFFLTIRSFENLWLKKSVTL